MQIIIEPGGAVRCIYTEDIDLAAIGSPVITRASHVEPDQQGRWRGRSITSRWAYAYRLFARRSEALGAEHAWFGD